MEALTERYSAAVQTLETLQEALKVVHDPADRNLTSHSYNEVLAQEMLERIPLYHISMKQVITKLKL